MTKKVRIENADTSTWKVRVFIERKDADGNWKRTDEEAPSCIDFPTALHEGYIHSHQRLVVEEAA